MAADAAGKKNITSAALQQNLGHVTVSRVIILIFPAQALLSLWLFWLMIKHVAVAPFKFRFIPEVFDFSPGL